MFIIDVIVGMLFTCSRIIFVYHIFFWYFCFGCALYIFCVRLRITYRNIFLFLNTVLSVGCFFVGSIVFVIDIIFCLIDVFVVGFVPEIG